MRLISLELWISAVRWLIQQLKQTATAKPWLERNN